MIKRKKPIRRSARIRSVSQRDVPRLKRKLWSLLSPEIRERDGHTCVSCGRGHLSGSNWQAGHLFPAGSHSATRFHPHNIHTQCFRCNISLSGNAAEYSSWFISEYGLPYFERMKEASRPTKKWTPDELVVLIEKIKVGLGNYTAFYVSNYGPVLFGG